ncbi:MAG: dienelactone hydrolase [Hyphomicrobiaceae bacterium]|nr:MAG: dienelactone hydrolase [Hyphomicrobiaceae bacterium]
MTYARHRRRTAWAMLFSLAAGLAQAQDTPRPPVADTGEARPLEAPVDTRPVKDKFWLAPTWLEDGQIEAPANYRVIRRQMTYVSPIDNTEITGFLFRPAGDGRYPAVLFAHGRRGLDPLAARLAIRLAARGFVVLAPDLYQSRLIEPMPVKHDPMLDSDIGAGIDALLKLPDVSTSAACLVSHTRGGYYTLRAAVAGDRQGKSVACYVSYYPHWQDPNLGEPDQVYRFAPEVERLKVPALVFVGEFEQYQRRRSIEEGVRALKRLGRQVRLVIYPGVGRGFDFRAAEVRTFADDLAAKDAAQRTGTFLAETLKAYAK